MRSNVLRILIVLLTITLNTEVYGVNYEHKHEKTMHTNELRIELTLNNGERWIMDEHTRLMSSEMEKTFFSGDHSTLKGLNDLAVNLELQIKKLIIGCTMEGEEHNQLHTFLKSYIPEVSKLRNATSYDLAKERAIKIKTQLFQYKKHFK